MNNAEVTFSYKTRRNSTPRGKPRVYFTCHPKDFEQCFDKICKDIFKTHDCVIYYTDDMTVELSSSNSQTDLKWMNLFVIPITQRLLTQPNRAMDSDVRFAIENHISVLPIMMEAGLEEIYCRPDRFGTLQFINPYSDDLSEISYNEKLKKYLDSVLISDAIAQRVRKAFDTYIFLSYRKKDRAYANELMRLIHKNPELRDVAIWFDEFLTPGESFKENIEKMLNSSDLFTLLVTPNLLEMPDGNPNFVMSEEYPAAKRAGKIILPSEMRPTDKQSLKSSFCGIPECVNARNDIEFRERLLCAIKDIAVTESKDDPEHNYLIGLAYLEGIDVEVDIERGVELISSSAQCCLPEAMVKLHQMYMYGDKVSQDYWVALIWAEKLHNVLCNTKGNADPETINALYNLSIAYSKIEDYSKASELLKKTYDFQRQTLGDVHRDTLLTLNNLANILCKTGDVHSALPLYEKAYALCSKNVDREDLTIAILENLARVHGRLGNVQQEQDLYEKAYELRKKLFGEDDFLTINSLEKLANTYYKTGAALRAMELYKNLYNLRCSTLGVEARLTTEALRSIACAYYKLGEFRKAEGIIRKVHQSFCTAVELGNHSKVMTKIMGYYDYSESAWDALEKLEKSYELCCKKSGECSQDTNEILKKIATSYHKLATAYHKQGDYCKALELYDKAYRLRCKSLSEYSPQTITTIKKLANTHRELGDLCSALDFYEQAYKLCLTVYGEKDRRTISTIKSLAGTYAERGDYFKAQQLYGHSHELIHQNYAEERQARSIATLKKKASTYLKVGDASKALELYEEIYSLNCSILGEEDPQTLTALNSLAVNYASLGDYQKAKELREKVYTLRCKVLGEDHINTVRTLYGLIIACDALGEYQKELELQEKYFDIQCKVYGVHHERTRHAFQMIEELKRKLGG